LPPPAITGLASARAFTLAFPQQLAPPGFVSGSAYYQVTAGALAAMPCSGGVPAYATNISASATVLFYTAITGCASATTTGIWAGWTFGQASQSFGCGCSSPYYAFLTTSVTSPVSSLAAYEWGMMPDGTSFYPHFVGQPPPPAKTGRKMFQA
jgi:hypothetical protein